MIKFLVACYWIVYLSFTIKINEKDFLVGPKNTFFWRTRTFFSKKWKKALFFNHFFQKAVYSTFEASTISETKIRLNKESSYIDRWRPGEFIYALICRLNAFKYIVCSLRKKMALFGENRTKGPFWGQNGPLARNTPFSNKKRFFATVGFIRCMGT